MTMSKNYTPLCRVAVDGRTFDIALRAATTRHGNRYFKIAVTHEGRTAYGAGFIKPGRTGDTYAASLALDDIGLKGVFTFETPMVNEYPAAADLTTRAAFHRQAEPRSEPPRAERAPRGPFDDIFEEMFAGFGAGKPTARAAARPVLDGSTTLDELFAAQRLACRADISRVRRALALLMHPDGVADARFPELLKAFNVRLDEADRAFRPEMALER